MAIVGTFALSTTTIPTGNVLTTLSFIAISDPNSLLSSGNLFTIPAGQGGTYFINQQITNTLGQTGVLLRSQIIYTGGSQSANYSLSSLYSGLSPILQLNAGDTFQIQVANNSTAIANLDTANSRLQVVQLA